MNEHPDDDTMTFTRFTESTFDVISHLFRHPDAANVYHTLLHIAFFFYLFAGDDNSSSRIYPSSGASHSCTFTLVFPFENSNGSAVSYFICRYTCLSSAFDFIANGKRDEKKNYRRNKKAIEQTDGKEADFYYGTQFMKKRKTISPCVTCKSSLKCADISKLKAIVPASPSDNYESIALELSTQTKQLEMRPLFKLRPK